MTNFERRTGNCDERGTATSNELRRATNCAEQRTANTGPAKGERQQTSRQYLLLVRDRQRAVFCEALFCLPTVAWKRGLHIVGAVRARLNGMESGRLSELTNEAATLTVSFVEALPHSLVYFKLGGQLLDSGTSSEANYRAAQRARSPADFVGKLKIVEEEADESMLWIDQLQKAGLSTELKADAERLRDMFDQIVALTVKSIKTTRARHLKAPKPRRPR
jgi:four helix bundle protein